jgi:hypothetical protein
MPTEPSSGVTGPTLPRPAELSIQKKPQILHTCNQRLDLQSTFSSLCCTVYTVRNISFVVFLLISVIYKGAIILQLEGNLSTIVE